MDAWLHQRFVRGGYNNTRCTMRNITVVMCGQCVVILAFCSRIRNISSIQWTGWIPLFYIAQVWTDEETGRLEPFQNFHCVGMQPVAAILCLMGTGCTLASTSSKHDPALMRVRPKFAKQRVKKFCTSYFEHHNTELLITIHHPNRSTYCWSTSDDQNSQPNEQRGYGVWSFRARAAAPAPMRLWHCQLGILPIFHWIQEF